MAPYIPVRQGHIEAYAVSKIQNTQVKCITLPTYLLAFIELAYALQKLVKAEMMNLLYVKHVCCIII